MLKQAFDSLPAKKIDSAPELTPKEPVELAESKPSAKIKEFKTLKAKAITLHKSLKAEPQEQKIVFEELGFTELEGAKEEIEIDEKFKLKLLKVVTKLEDLEEVLKEELELEELEELTKPEEENEPNLESPELAEEMIKDDLKITLQQHPALDEIIRMNGWEHLHLRTNRNQQLVFLAEQGGVLTPVEVWDGMSIMRHQGLFGMISFLEQTRHSI